MHAWWEGPWLRWRHGPWATFTRRLGYLIHGPGAPTEVPIARLRARPFGPDAGHVAVPDTPHVAFLREFADADDVDPGRFDGSPYDLMARDCIRRRGVFFGIRDPHQVLERARYFHALHRAIASNTPLPPFHRAPDRSGMPVVIPVSGSDLLQLHNGHHRTAIYHVLGRPTVRVRVVRPTTA